MTWRTLFLDVRSGLFIPRLVTRDPETGEFTCVDGPKGFETWEEADQAAGRFLEKPSNRRSSQLQVNGYAVVRGAGLRGVPSAQHDGPGRA